MNFYGLLTVQKTNFELASKWFGTAKQKDIQSDVLFLLLGGEKKVDSEARAHAVVWR